MIRRLVGLLGRERWWVALTALLAFATLASSIGLIATSAHLISRSALVSTTARLAVAITAVRLFAVSRAGFRYLERYVGHLTTFRALTRLRVWLFRGLEPLAPARLLGHRGGDLLARMVADVDTLQDFYLRVAVPSVAAALCTVLASLLLAHFAPLLGVTILVFLLVAGAVVPLAGARLARADAAAVVTGRAGLSSTAVEGLDGMAELVAYGREDLFAGAIATHTTTAAAHQQRLASVRGTTAGLSTLLTGLAALTLLALAVPMVTDGTLRGELLAVMPLTALAAFEAVAPLGAAVDQMGRTRAAAGRLFDLVDSPPAVADPPGPAGTVPAAPVPAGSVPTLELRGLTFAHGPDLPPALADVSATIPAGARVALVGPSGSGKSTLVALLLRWWDYDHGSIRFVTPGPGGPGPRGTELRDLRAADARRLVAAVQQHDHLFDTTVRDNLLLADGDATDDRIEAALAAADALGFVRDLPTGLDARIGEDGDRLSGGERQRLMIARALLADAPVLVLDEATAHLDAETQRRVLHGVQRWQAGRTLVVISHDEAAIEGVDLVLRLDRGRLTVGTGTS